MFVRICDCNTQNLVDIYLIPLEAKDCSANEMFSYIERFFNLYDIPFENLIGFSSDNSSPMMGQKRRVQTLVRREPVVEVDPGRHGDEVAEQDIRTLSLTKAMTIYCSV